MTEQIDQMTEIRKAKKTFRISLAAAVVLAFIAAMYSRITGVYFGESILLKGIMAVVGAMIFIPGARAMGIPCPGCKKPFHNPPMYALLPLDKCKNCGYPENSG